MSHIDSYLVNSTDYTTRQQLKGSIKGEFHRVSVQNGAENLFSLATMILMSTSPMKYKSF